MTTNSPIKNNVMRRVYVIRALRPIVSGGALALVVLAAALWEIGREVWVAKVFANGPQNLIGHAEYLWYAFNHTHLSVELLSVVALAATIYLARATAHAIVVMATPAYAS